MFLHLAGSFYQLLIFSYCTSYCPLLFACGYISIRACYTVCMIRTLSKSDWRAEHILIKESQNMNAHLLKRVVKLRL